jgi:hypothetical protein
MVDLVTATQDGGHIELAGGGLSRTRDPSGLGQRLFRAQK